MAHLGIAHEMVRFRALGAKSTSHPNGWKSHDIPSIYDFNIHQHRKRHRFQRQHVDSKKKETHNVLVQQGGWIMNHH